MLDVEFEFGFNFPEWHKDALRQEDGYDPDDWFPERGESSKAVRAVCARCLVQRDCLAWALDEGPQLPGLWGGTSQRERKQLLKEGRLTGDLVRKWGAHAVEGRRIERWDEYDRQREAEIMEGLQV